jgi:hypothetical protein
MNIVQYFKKLQMKRYLNIFLSSIILMTIAGCGKEMTEYREFLDKKELVYPGVVSKFKASPGNGRVLLTWNPSPDPSVKKYIVYWNDGNDSLSVNATSHNPSDIIEAYINELGEYSYTFSLVSFDDKGNRSIATKTKSVKVYGPLYAAGLVNRTYRADHPSTFNAEGLTLNFNEPDTVNITTEIKYTSVDGQEKKVLLDPSENSITLSDYKVGQPILYQSAYLPTTGAIDIFRPASYDRFPVDNMDVTALFLKNAINPIQPLETDIGDRFRSPRDWIVNDAVKNKTGNSVHGAKMGGWGADAGGSLLMTTEAPQPDVVNGKIYQTVKLPAGKYKWTVFLNALNVGSNPNLMVVVPATTLPNLNGNVPAGTSIAYTDLGNQQLSFELNEETTVSIGFLMNVPAGNYWILRTMTLTAQF